MTPNAQHKRAERERRRKAGERRVELWLDDAAQKDLAAIMQSGMTKEDALCSGLMAYRYKMGI